MTDENGSKAFKHAKCLYYVKVALRKWNLNVFGNFQIHINDIHHQINVVRMNLNVDSATDQLVRLEEPPKHWYSVK